MVSTVVVSTVVGSTTAISTVVVSNLVASTVVVLTVVVLMLWQSPPLGSRGRQGKGAQAGLCSWVSPRS